MFRFDLRTILCESSLAQLNIWVIENRHRPERTAIERSGGVSPPACPTHQTAYARRVLNWLRRPLLSRASISCN